MPTRLPRRTAPLLLAVVLAACSQATISPSPSSAPTDAAPTPTAAASLDTTPVSDHVSDGLFELTATIPAAQATTTTALLPNATFSYVGPDPTIEIGHGAPLVSWSIHEIGGGRTMSGGVDTVCQSSVLTKGVEAEQPFLKGGQIDDNPLTGFDITWFQQPQLKLPAGRWALTATMDLYVGGCGAEHHTLTATVEVEVLR